jgi:hypothetical protein
VAAIDGRSLLCHLGENKSVYPNWLPGMATNSIDVEKLATLGLFPENLPAAYTTKNIWAPFAVNGDTFAITKPCIGSSRNWERQFPKAPVI